MAEFFDMISGTSTGSLLAASLVLPNPNDTSKNLYWAEDAIKIYTDKGAEVFQHFELDT